MRDHDFSNPKYWEAEYANAVSEMSTMDWYGLGADKMWSLLQPLLPAATAADVLEVGCGSRPLLPGLHAIANSRFDRLLATDLSPTIIARLVEAQGRSGVSSVEFGVADCRRTGQIDESFDVVLDKATCDALMSGTDHHESVFALAREAARLLRPNGHLVVVTHFQVDYPDAPPECNATPLLDALLAGLIAGAPHAAWTATAHVPDPNDCPRVLAFCKRPPRRVSRGRSMPPTTIAEVLLKMKIIEHG